MEQNRKLTAAINVVSLSEVENVENLKRLCDSRFQNVSEDREEIAQDDPPEPVVVQDKTR